MTESDKAILEQTHICVDSEIHSVMYAVEPGKGIHIIAGASGYLIVSGEYLQKFVEEVTEVYKLYGVGR
jgi:hypothetical protein